MKRKDIIFVIVYVFGVFSTTLLREWLKKVLSLNTWNNTYFVLAVIGVFVVYMLSRFIPSVCHKIKRGIITYDRVDEILQQYKTISGEKCFILSQLDEDNLRSRLKDLGLKDIILPWRRPLLFHTFGFRKNIFWVDYIYLRLLADFAQIGFDVRIVIHNEDFVYHNGVATSTYFGENDPQFKAYQKNIYRAFGHNSSMKFFCGQDLANRSRKLRKRYINLIYDRFVPYLSFVIESIISGARNAKSVRNDVINFIDSLIVLCLPRRPFLIGLYYKPQADKWKGPPLSAIKEETSMILLSSDIVKPKTHESNVYDPSTRISLLDDEAEMKMKVFSADDTVLNTIAKVLLHLSPEEYMWEQWLESLKTSEIIESLRKKLSMMFPNVPEQYQNVIFQTISKLKSQSTQQEVDNYLASCQSQLALLYLRHQVLIKLLDLGKFIQGQN